MNETLKGYFDSIGVTHFSVIRYSDCREINERLRLCLDFTPKTAVVFLLPYYAGETVNISRYAASLDYHLILREVAEGLTATLREKYPDAHFVGYGDHSPIDEVHAALISGLGIRGDNGLIINETYGSYVFVGDLLTDIDPDVLGATLPMGGQFPDGGHTAARREFSVEREVIASLPLRSVRASLPRTRWHSCENTIPHGAVTSVSHPVRITKARF